MKQLFTAIMVLILIASCKTPCNDIQIQQIQCANKFVTQSHTLPPFKSIVATGHASIELVNGSCCAKIAGLENELDRYQFTIQDQVLYVSAPAPVTNANIVIAASRVKDLIVTDNATITSKNFKTTGLSVAAHNNGTMNLEGRLAINKIGQMGNGRINIEWIDSNRLFIDSSSSGPLYLAGTVTNMVAKLTGSANLDARYLRAKKATVLTTDHARADVVALDALEAFAIDKSNIYYYKRPKHFTPLTKGSGNVLHPDWIN
jgi:hypothetical protein